MSAAPHLHSDDSSLHSECTLESKRCRRILTEEEALAIFSAGKPCAGTSTMKLWSRGQILALSRDYNVTPKTIRDIWKRRTWRSVTDKFIKSTHAAHQHLFECSQVSFCTYFLDIRTQYLLKFLMLFSDTCIFQRDSQKSSLLGNDNSDEGGEESSDSINEGMILCSHQEGGLPPIQKVSDQHMSFESKGGQPIGQVSPLQELESCADSYHMYESMFTDASLGSAAASQPTQSAGLQFIGRSPMSHGTYPHLEPGTGHGSQSYQIEQKPALALRPFSSPWPGDALLLAAAAWNTVDENKFCAAGGGSAPSGAPKGTDPFAWVWAFW
jgi:hypothetical protein